MTREQLDLARRKSFSLAGNALLTFDDARAWLDHAGLVLWTPKPTQLPAPAPSFVAAVSGQAEPGLEAAEQAKSLLARLVRDGAAVPLYLMSGGSAVGETPDFIASVGVLPYIYTLRGDKNWKSAPLPETLSPLALKIYNLLKEKGSMTASEMVPELGRELTQAAALRGLAELWSTLRVYPVPQDDGEESRWELLTTRFTKAIKSGGNAGVPTSLSALISLYLGSSLLAMPEEIEIFLSPLIARSKIREAVNGLRAARQLDEVVLDGKTLFHVHGDLPEFEEIPEPVAADADEAEAAADLGSVGEPELDREALLERSRKRVAKTFSEDRGSFERKPAPRRASGDRPERSYSDRPPRPAGDRPSRSYGDRPARPAGDRERRPFTRSGEAGGERKPFTRERKSFGDRKPYERKSYTSRAEGEAKPAFEGERKPYPRKPASGDRKSFGDRKPYSRRPEGEERPFTRKPFDGERKSFGDRKPYARRTEGEGKPPFDGERKPYPRRDGDRKSFGDRKPFVRRAEGDRKPFDGERKSFGDRKPYVRRTEGEGRPPFDRERKPYPRKEGDRGSFGDRKPFVRRAEGDRKPFEGERKSFGDRKPYVRRAEGEGKPPFDRERKPYPRKEGTRGSFGDRKPFSGDRKPYSRRPAEGEAGDRKPFRPRTEGKPSFGAKKFGGGGGKFGGPARGGDRKFGGPRKSGPGKPRTGGSDRPRTPRRRPEGEGTSE